VQGPAGRGRAFDTFRKTRAGETFIQWWKAELAPLHPGVCRIDVLKSQEPVRRTFFRVTDWPLARGEQERIEQGGSRVGEEDDLKAELARLKEENERLKSRTGRGLSLKVSEKGALSVYGLGRFPVTLYKEQWQKLLGMADEIREFLKENDAQLKSKS
jgi:hypothetical protein